MILENSNELKKTIYFFKGIQVELQECNIIWRVVFQCHPVLSCPWLIYKLYRTSKYEVT